MKRLFTSLACLFFAVSSGIAWGQALGKNPMADLSFIKGNWIAEANGRSIEGFWLSPKDDNIMGFFRIMNGGKPKVYELLVYEQTGTGFLSLVRHFGQGLKPQEPDDKPVKHTCIESGKGRVVFEKEGEPVRILYESQGDDKFRIAVGKPEGEKWVYNSLFEFKRVQ